MIKPENFINIQGWMKTNLGLQGNELLVFAIIFGFCQDEESEFSGGVKYISEWIGCSYPTAISLLKKLCEKNLISKKEVITDKGRFVNYRVIKNLNDGLLNNLTTPIKNFNNPAVKNFNTEIESILNTINNTKIKECMVEWVQYKKEKKDSYTPSGLKKCISRLQKLSGGDPTLAQEIVDSSMANGYAGLFLPKCGTPKKESVWEHNMRLMKEMEEENANESLF